MAASCRVSAFCVRLLSVRVCSLSVSALGVCSFGPDRGCASNPCLMSCVRRSVCEHMSLSSALSDPSLSPSSALSEPFLSPFLVQVALNLGHVAAQDAAREAQQALSNSGNGLGIQRPSSLGPVTVSLAGAASAVVAAGRFKGGLGGLAAGRGGMGGGGRGAQRVDAGWRAPAATFTSAATAARQSGDAGSEEIGGYCGDGSGPGQVAPGSEGAVAPSSSGEETSPISMCFVHPHTGLMAADSSSTPLLLLLLSSSPSLLPLPSSSTCSSPRPPSSPSPSHPHASPSTY